MPITQVMSTNMFVVYILAITYGMTLFYTKAREHFTPVDAYKEKIVHLEHKVKEERVKHMLTSYEFQDFRSHVGSILPEAIKKRDVDFKNSEKSFPLRTLASVTQRQPSNPLAFTRAKNIFEEGKRLFRDKKYEEAATSFTLLVKKHPYSAYIPEAMFLSIESNFILRRYDQCIEHANRMLDLYPDSELTGYALLRLGKIYEQQERHEEAIEIYKTVVKSFPFRDLASLATQQLRAIEL